MDNEKISKAPRGQTIKEVTALDRSSVGSKAQAALSAAEGTFKGGIDNLSHSLSGVVAKQDVNSPQGRKDTVKYPSA